MDIVYSTILACVYYGRFIPGMNIFLAKDNNLLVTNTELPNGSLLYDLGLIKTFSPKKSYFSRIFFLKVVFLC